MLGALATHALVDELALEHKPGLVTMHDRGPHRDLDADRMLHSALALRETFDALQRCARAEPPSRALREELGALGRRGERAMLRETRGSNTHRGAIWSVGLLCAAASSLGNRPYGAEMVAARAAAFARLPDRFARRATNGAEACARYATGGAAAQARRAFPRVLRGALPALRAARERGEDETAARLRALLALIATLDDTCLLHRGGAAGLRFARTGARRFTRTNQCAPLDVRAVERFGRALTARGLSPGGSADLLASALFLDRLSRVPPPGTPDLP